MASLPVWCLAGGGTMDAVAYRLTQYAHGGGCACKIPPGELEDVVRGLTKAQPRDPVGVLLVGSTTATTRPRCGSRAAWR